MFLLKTLLMMFFLILEMEQLKITFTKEVANAKWDPRVKKGWWDGKISYFKSNRYLPAGLWHELVETAKQYNFEIQVNWIGERNTELLFNRLLACALEHPQKSVSKQKAFPLPQRLWHYIIDKTEISADKKWIDLGKKKGRHLAELLANDVYTVSGKTTFKEEFVTCGGVTLDSIHLKTMGSKTHKGLYFAGEVLNIDAITGGYNFQAAWSTGFIAGQLG